MSEARFDIGGNIMSWTVQELMNTLKKMDPDAQVEFEIPRDLPGDRNKIKGGDRVFLTNAKSCWYNDPDNKWVTLS